MMFTILQVHALAYAQRVNIHVQKASLKQVLYQISKQTGYNFICDGNISAKLPPITLNAVDMPLAEVLDKCLGDDVFEVNYNEDKTIIIREKREIKQLQDIPIRGVVTDEKGETLVGVSITVQSNPSYGTRTNNEGQFSLNIPAKAILVISYLGFKKQEIPYTGQSELKITMQ
ncbi:MAG: carboxypeptidase-like regulatory domain-containing protein, partial [Sphingobacterium sp.]